MKSICFHFQLNQPHRLKTYRFFDINQHHDYFDLFQNKYITKRLTERCYLPANEMLLRLIQQFGEKVAFSFSISGSTLHFLEEYQPEALTSFQTLSNTGRIEITGNTYTHSLAALHNKSSFIEQVRLQEHLLKKLFNIQPQSFCNTECIYSDEIGEWLHEIGYKTVLTEGAKHILGWKNPGYLYCNPYQTEQKLLLRHREISNNIEYHFSDGNITADSVIAWLDASPADVPFINIYLDYEMIGEIYTAETGIFDFFQDLFTKLATSPNYQFIMPSDIQKQENPAATLHVPWPIAGSGEESNINEWLGNELQQDAFQQLFKLEALYNQSDNENAKLSWLRLQSAEHFDYMATRWFPQHAVRKNFEVYSSPYQAFINYMNIVNDIEIQLNEK